MAFPSVTVCMSRRLIAVLDHDGIPATGRVSYLAKACGFSRTTARRLLSDHHANLRFLTWRRLGLGLDVGIGWLLDGSGAYFHARTWRIEVEQVKGYPAEDAAHIVRMFSASLMGHGKADNLMRLVASGQMSVMQAARLL